MPEILLWYVCTYGYGCSEMTNAYIEYNIELKESVKNIKNKVNSEIPLYLQKYGYPVLLTLYSKQDIVIPLGNHFYLDTDNKLSANRLRWTYEF
jgi:hypothetical protein